MKKQRVINSWLLSTQSLHRTSHREGLWLCTVQIVDSDSSRYLLVVLHPLQTSASILAPNYHQESSLQLLLFLYTCYMTCKKGIEVNLAVSYQKIFIETQ